MIDGSLQNGLSTHTLAFTCNALTTDNFMDLMADPVKYSSLSKWSAALYFLTKAKNMHGTHSLYRLTF